MSNELTIQQAPMFGLSTLEEAVNFAGQMAKANLLPAHLKGSPADCLRVVMQAARWQMDPFSVADKTSVISGKLMYEGQLVSAVVNARGNLTKRLDYKFEGDGEKRTLTVTGTLKGEQEPREITLDVAMARRINKNGQMNQNPDQQMCYIGARMWARRHTSELMLGVYTPDEIDPDDNQQPENVTPVTDRPPPPKRAAKGAAAVIEQNNPKEVVGELVQEPDVNAAMKAREQKMAEASKVKVVEPVKSEPAKAVEAEIAKVVEAAKVEPAVTPRAFIKDQEELTAICEVVSLGDIGWAEPVLRDGTKKKMATVVAVVSGNFSGKVFHFGGADDQLKPIPEWTVGNKVRLKLYGKQLKNGSTQARVESVQMAGSEMEAE